MAVGGNAAAGEAAEIAVPDIQQAQAQRQVALHAGGKEMRIHGMGAIQQRAKLRRADGNRSEEHTSELQSPCNLVCRLLLEKKKKPTKLAPVLLIHAR